MMNDSLMGRRRSINHEKTIEKDNQPKVSHAKFVDGVCPTCGRKKPTRKTSSRRTKREDRAD